jgi:hypothetical protein
MSEVLDKCPNCQSYNVQTKVVHNPDTCDMNAEATLACLDCKQEWEGKVMSPRMEEDRRRGFAI